MSSLNDTDLFIIERSGTNYQVRSDEMSTLNDTDLFVVERGGVQYKVEAADINIDSGPTGSIDAPVAVLTPLNGAGTNAEQSYNPLSTAITAVGAGGAVVYATDTIVSVNGNVLTFPSDKDFDKFEVGDVVQDPYAITAIDDSNPYLITVDGGSWYGADGTGDAGDGRYEPSQQWSAGMKTTITDNTSYSTTGRTSTFPDSLPPTAPFDADLTNYVYSQTGAMGTWLYVEFGTALTNVTSIVFSTEYSCPGGVIKLNGVDVGVDRSNVDVGFVDVSVTGAIPASLTEIAIQGHVGSARLKYLKINNALLLDSATPGGLGATDITKTVSSDVSLTFTDDTELANMVGPLTMVNENGVDQGVSAADVAYLNGSTLGVSNVTGTWVPGLFAQGAEVTQNAPSPNSVVFTSSNGGTTAFTGTDATLASRTWTLESGNSSSGPWTVVGEYEDTSATASQDGSVSWTGHPALEANKFYKVKVKYNAGNADSVESTFNTFKTGEE